VPPFGRLLSSYTINLVGDSAGIVALAVLVYAETRDPLATMALFLAAEFLPAFVAPAVTARLDQLSLRRVLPAIYLTEAVIFGALALVASDFLLPALLVLTFLDGIFMLTARGLTRGAINAVLSPRQLLREGNGLINIGFAVSSVGGAALGGLLVEAFGAPTVLLVDAASFVAVAVLLATSRGLPRAIEPEQREPFLPRLREGMRFAREDRFVRLLLAGQGMALVLFTLVVPIEIVYAKETLDTSDAGYGILLSAWGAGIVLGSVVFIAVKTRSPFALVLASTAAIGVAMIGMSLTTSLLVACAWSVLGGLGNGIQWVSVMTAVQEGTPRDLQARITGLLESIASGATGVGFLLGGIIVALASPSLAFLVSGIGVLLLVVAAARVGGGRRLTEAQVSSEATLPEPPPVAPVGRV
jgi:MFS family permease